MKNIEKAETTYTPEPEISPTPDLADPGEGKGWRRKSDGYIYIGSVYLGKLFFINGKRLDEPIDEKPEDFELVDLLEG
ncbi:hypothetical protein JGH11_04655 [Dysgonomonas sp. Marseille-P4677]|uniref:hypothetical protein n=1 Tax=Dysgonomonas sp. Marseille-P4677 TaxID=2364790 RepID=UPI00191478EF|nr:hypothetical protein [Dysgonomonas sp. Marseille-P4677]MBK5720158.1 hypothetical protein [Dysgonomonas sp. Marseille-P4677]